MALFSSEEEARKRIAGFGLVGANLPDPKKMELEGNAPNKWVILAWIAPTTEIWWEKFGSVGHYSYHVRSIIPFISPDAYFVSGYAGAGFTRVGANFQQLVAEAHINRGDTVLPEFAINAWKGTVGDFDQLAEWMEMYHAPDFAWSELKEAV